MKNKNIYLQLEPEQFKTVLKMALKEILTEEQKTELRQNAIPTNLLYDSEDKILNLKETAKLLNLSITTIKHKIYKKQIPYFKIGKRTVFNKSEILKLLNNNTNDYVCEMNSKYNILT
jgi:excisionase family DNA binding protein